MANKYKVTIECISGTCWTSWIQSPEGNWLASDYQHTDSTYEKVESWARGVIQADKNRRNSRRTFTVEG